MYFGNEKGFLRLVILIFLWTFCQGSRLNLIPCNASLPESQSCPASLYYVPNTPKTLNETASLFNVNPSFINKTVDGFLIAINCSCPVAHNEFVWHTNYQVQDGDTWEKVSTKFGSLILEKPDKVLLPDLTVIMDVFCACSQDTDVVTYKIEKGDTLYTICSRFNASVNLTSRFNNLTNPNLIFPGDIIYIPEPAFESISLSPDNKDLTAEKESKSRIYIVVGSTLAAFTVIFLSLTFSVRIRHKRTRTQHSKLNPGRMHVHLDTHPKSEESVVYSVGSDKATVFPYQEIREAAANFSMSAKIGQGSFGSVYLGKLRGTDVAIKQMKSTKSKEFFSEINILCNVHHTNLIELIGYAAGGDSLFLVYEFAQNGALSDHLHRPEARGYKPLSWTRRVRIALDAAKGLEYIHERTKPYYVHRDVKTSNILLDSNFRAKIADFGLVKLLEHSPEVGASASRIVGTFGYLAPEYVRDGRVTTKSDVYSFGVVLMELLVAQPALSRDAATGNDQYFVHRSLVDYMLSALNDANNSVTKLIECIDPNLINYDADSLLQMALLSEDCVNGDCNQRPDMSVVVFRLSQILMRTEQWEKLTET